MSIIGFKELTKEEFEKLSEKDKRKYIINKILGLNLYKIILKNKE